jgi:hypothetical protein
MLIRNDPLLQADREVVSDLQRRLTALGRYTGPTSGEYDESIREAIARFAGEQNLEGKLRDDDQIYESVVREIRDVTPEIPEPGR